MTAQDASPTTTGNQTLGERMLAIEDRLAILNLLAGSALSSDVAAAEYWQGMYADNAIMDRGNGQIDSGLEELLAVVSSAGQKSAADYGMAHLSAVPHIVIDCDTAVATGYLLIVVPSSGAGGPQLPGKGPAVDLAIYHLTVNRWDLVRSSAGWKVLKRTIRPLGSDEANEMIHAGIRPSLPK